MTYFSKVIYLTLVLPGLLANVAIAADPASQREQEWNRAVRAAEQEGEVVLSSLSEVGEVFTHGGFQKKFPKIKLTVITARGGDQVTRVMAERRAGKFLVDVGNMGNTSPYRLYQAKVLDPIASAFLLPEVEDESKWWQGKHQFIDPEGKYIFVYVAAPLYLVGYNTKLVNPGEFKSY
jgi:ABC-type glycerol-3-phosphate transport system substrate-binding protein